MLKEDLAGAIETIQSILQQANASIAREEREDALLDLNDRVEDWKSLRIDSFGELMLFGTFSVLKGDGGGKDQEKEVSFPSMSLFVGAKGKVTTSESMVKGWTTDISPLSITSTYFNVYFCVARI